jgi:homoserine dehydrogenase
MKSKRKIGIGLLGLGVVGSEVASGIARELERWEQRVGIPLELIRVLVRDLTKLRPVSIDQSLLTTEASSIIDDPNIDVLVEVLGSIEPANTYIRQAIGKGKHVVTANKEVMAVYGPELIELAESAGVNLLYEASVGGGMPIIGPLRKDLLANEFNSLHAIINGTTNYILGRMSKEGVSFESALLDAKELGYAEPDPSMDIDGTDAAHKLAILASLVFHTKVSLKDVYKEGISSLDATDFQYAKGFGFEIKLLGIANRYDNNLIIRVHPVLIPEEQLLAKVDGVFNAIELNGDLVGRIVIHGLGAGPYPTSSAVIGDILEAARSIYMNVKPLQGVSINEGLNVVPMDSLVTEYYVRMSLADRAGVLPKITSVFGDLDISIASVIQKSVNSDGGIADFVIMTHPSLESHMRQAIPRLTSLEEVKDVNNVIRVER